MDFIRNPPKNIEWFTFLMHTGVSTILLVISLVNITMGWGQHMEIWKLLLAGCLGYFIPSSPMAKRAETLFHDPNTTVAPSIAAASGSGASNINGQPQSTAAQAEVIQPQQPAMSTAQSVQTQPAAQIAGQTVAPTTPRSDATAINSDIPVGGTQLAKAT